MSDTKISSTDPATERRTALAGDEHAGWRLDRFLAAALPDFSRSRLQQLLEAEAVSLGARTIKDANHRVKPGENYTVAIPPTAPASSNCWSREREKSGRAAARKRSSRQPA